MRNRVKTAAFVTLAMAVSVASPVVAALDANPAPFAGGQTGTPAPAPTIEDFKAQIAAASKQDVARIVGQAAKAFPLSAPSFVSQAAKAYPSEARYIAQRAGKDGGSLVNAAAVVRAAADASGETLFTIALFYTISNGGNSTVLMQAARNVNLAQLANQTPTGSNDPSGVPPQQQSVNVFQVPGQTNNNSTANVGSNQPEAIVLNSLQNNGGPNLNGNGPNASPT